MFLGPKGGARAPRPLPWVHPCLAQSPNAYHLSLESDTIRNTTLLCRHGVGPLGTLCRQEAETSPRCLPGRPRRLKQYCTRADSTNVGYYTIAGV